ncbi:RHS repeat protein [Bacteroides sp. K03]|uniref:RHS repeat domain-containing protein n=1 Tax=Bacteroides sp. K03 TaxID=2718928 RepID=UPI001C8C4794|nr:RHS repeat domain-containing protein [Bacteroides sp. K03]MBX9188672.1 RHS repeat protein [Bacteroides sp. K03]
MKRTIMSHKKIVEFEPYSKGLLSKVNRQGEVTNYDYDSNNRLSEIRIDGKHTCRFG